MKAAFITVGYQTPKKEIDRLKKEVQQLGFSDYQFYYIDNTANNIGYAGGVNQGIRWALKDKSELLIIFNPDISFEKINKQVILAGTKRFPIFGFSFEQNGNRYFGGEIDRWRMSGGLIKELPQDEYQTVDYVSGSLMIIKPEVIRKVGMFTEDYFMYYEDVDFCYRARQSGFKSGINAHVSYSHFETSDKTNLAKKDLLLKNRLRFFWKYASLNRRIYEFARLPKTIYEERNFVKRFFFNSSFLVNYFGLNLASLLTKLLNFIWFLVMMQRFDPKEYGVYTLVWSQVNLLSPLVDLGTTSYGIVYSNKEKDLDSIISLRYFLGIIVFGLTLLGGWLFNSNWLFFIALTSATVFSNTTSGGYLIIKALKDKAYQASILAFVFNALLISCLIPGLLKTDSLTVVFIIISINYGLQALLYLGLIRRAIGKINFRFELQKWKRIVGKSYQFVLINILSQIYFKIDVFLLSALKSNAEVGVYSAGFKFFQTLIFFASSYTLSSTPKLARLADQDHSLMVKKMKKDLLFLSVFGFSLAIGFYLLAPFVLGVLMRKVYGASLTVAQITVFALPFILLSSVFFNVLYIMRKTSFVVYLFSFQLIFNFVLNRLFIPLFSFYASAWITVISEVVNLIILVIITTKLLRKEYAK